MGLYLIFLLQGLTHKVHWLALWTIWSEDLNIEKERKVWKFALKLVHALSICTRHGVLQCKLIHRVHWSKRKLACICPGTDPNCDKCHQGPANLSHMFWYALHCLCFWSLYLTLTLNNHIYQNPPLTLSRPVKGPAHYQLAATLSILTCCFSHTFSKECQNPDTVEELVCPFQYPLWNWRKSSCCLGPVPLAGWCPVLLLFVAPGWVRISMGCV